MTKINRVASGSDEIPKTLGGEEPNTDHPGQEVSPSGGVPPPLVPYRMQQQV